ncbi:MAG: hypothetical protein M3R47_03650 [Chloroflexota bacterium]|nr:hypothetical protein [Chloroflexota bacterium]
MSISILALLALVVIIAISAIRTDLNTGVLAVALAYIVGVYFAGLSVSEVSTYLPEQLVLTLVGITLMFEWLIFLAWVVITFIGGFAIVGAAHQHWAALN